MKYTRPKFFVVVISTFHFNNDLGCLQEFIYRDLVFPEFEPGGVLQRDGGP